MPTSKIIANRMTMTFIHTKFYLFVKQIYISLIAKRARIKKSIGVEKVPKNKAKMQGKVKPKIRLKIEKQVKRPIRAKNTKRQDSKSDDLK